MHAPNNPLCFWSNLLMFFPFYIAYKAGLTYTCAALLFCMGCSMFYHLDERDANALNVDLAGVVILISCIFYMLFNTIHILTPANIIAVVYAIMAVYYYFKGESEGMYELYSPSGEFNHIEFNEAYEYYHTGWHVLVTCMIAAMLYSHSNATYLTKPIRIVRPVSVQPAASESAPNIAVDAGADQPSTEHQKSTQVQHQTEDMSGEASSTPEKALETSSRHCRSDASPETGLIPVIIRNSSRVQWVYVQ